MAALFTSIHNQFDNQRKLVLDASVTSLRNNHIAMASAQRVFEQNCAACHGHDAKGQAALFPDLKDADWQWGNSEAQLEQTIRFGRIAVMPGWQAALGDNGVEQVIGYLLARSKNEPIEDGDAGKTLYSQFCVACHGADGTGNVLLGGPNLVDNIWLYGGDVESIRQSISVGRMGVMPRFQTGWTIRRFGC